MLGLWRGGWVAYCWVYGRGGWLNVGLWRGGWVAYCWVYGGWVGGLLLGLCEGWVGCLLLGL